MRHCTEIEVRFADIDAMGHVNNAVFLNYFEQARIGFFNNKVGGKWDWKNQGIVLARNEIDYLHPILLNDRVLIDTSIEHIGSKSITLTYHVHSAESENGIRSFAKGKSVIVTFDYAKGRPIEVPDEWRKAFEKSE